MSLGSNMRGDQLQFVDVRNLAQSINVVAVGAVIDTHVLTDMYENERRVPSGRCVYY